MAHLAVWLKRLIGAAAAAYLVLYLVLAILRIAYPFELEWMEGITLDHVQRVLDGKPIYVAPSLDFVPSIYPPLYYYASAAMATVTGMGFLPLRLVSLLASIGCLMLIFFFVRRETRDNFASFAAAGLFAATYRLSGAWLDIARVDSLFTFFLLVAVFTLKYARSRWAYLAAGLLLALSFWTKQTALVAFIPMALYVLWRRRAHALYFVAAFVLAVGIPDFFLSAATGGWSRIYMYVIPTGHVYDKGNFLTFWTTDLFLPLSVPILLSLVYLWGCARKSRAEEVRFWILCGAGMLATAYLPRIKGGNYDNDLIPAYALVAVLFGIALPTVLRWLSDMLDALPEGYPHKAPFQRALPVFLFGATVLAFGALVYPPWKQIPTSTDRTAGQELVRTVAAFPGKVWVSHHNFIARLAGKPGYASAQAMADIVQRSRKDKAALLLAEDVRRRLQAHEFAALIVDEDILAWFGVRDYAEQGPAIRNPEAFWPVTGCHARPAAICIPSAAAMIP